jgi:hypothetical protein
MGRDPANRRNRAPLERLAGAFPWLPPLEIGVGWAALVWDMAEDLEDLAGREALWRGREVLVTEVKAKHGRLSVTVHGETPETGRAAPPRPMRLRCVVAVAEERASRTCERCGRPGAPALHAGWWSTLCVEHHAAEERGR